METIKTCYTVCLNLPPREASPNFTAPTVAERIRAKQARSAYRRECAAKLKQAKIPALRRIRVSLTFYYWRGKTVAERYARSGYAYCQDIQNAYSSFKAGQDALIDAGIVPDDDYTHVELGTVRIVPHSQAEGRTEIVLRIEGMAQ